MIEELNDSIDMINVQLYNSGTMLGLDGKIYAEATPDFVVAMTEAVIRGFTCKGGIGHFSGLPASKVGVGLPGCKGRGYVEPSSLEAAMKYLLGKGPKPGKYELIKKEGYSNLRGMMTWSVNSDNSCSPPNGFVDLYKQLFTNDPYIKIYNPNVITITKENGGEIMVDLFNDNFKIPSETSSWTFANLPDGVSVGSVTILTDSTAKIILKGNSIQGENQGHIKNLTVIIDSNSLVNSGDEIRKSYGVELTSPGYFIPCRFEAEDFSRMIGAEIRAAEDETNGTKLGGWKNESFVEYDIVVEKSGSYTIEMRVASQNSNGNYSLHLDTNELIKTNIPNTGGWEKWKTISHEVNISKGEYTFRLNRLGGWFGLNWFNFKIDSANGLKRINYSNLTILPNPVENNLTLENVQKGNLSILDLKGAVVKSYSINPQQKIDISTLKKGIYFAIFEDNTGTSYRSKFVKK